MSFQHGFAGPAFGNTNMAGSGGNFGNMASSYGGGGYGGGYGGRGRGGQRDDRRGGGGGGGGGGRGGRGRGASSTGDRHALPPPPESSNARLRKMIIKFADEEDFDPIEDPPRLARALKKSWKEGCHGVFDGFRIGVTQEPHKHPHYVSLLLQLSRRYRSTKAETEEADPVVGEKRKAEDEDDAEWSREVLEALNTAFRRWVEGREWLNVRLCLQFFSLLVPAGLVSALSLLDIYKLLLSVLQEVGGGGERADRVIRAVGEGLMRSAKSLYELIPNDVEQLLESIETAVLGRRGGRDLCNPIQPILPSKESKEGYQDTLDQLVAALHALRENSFQPPDCLPRHWENMPLSDAQLQFDPYDLTAVSMPPELYGNDEPTTEASEGQTGGLQFYGDDVVLPLSTLNGWTLRSLALDIIYLFEVNRKECARILLSLRHFLRPDMFKSNTASEDAPTSILSLESLIVSTLLGAMLTLPTIASESLYYASVIAEMCRLSPNTVAPPVGRAVRKVYTLLGSGIDVEVVRRILEWFAVHLSNFGFQWMWKEWIPDLELPGSHPKRAFMRRLVDLEVRLAYFDRVKDSLPAPMQKSDAGVLAKEPPEAVWPYEDSDHPLHSEAIDLLQRLRQKASADDVRVYLESLLGTTPHSGEGIPTTIRFMTIETLLHLGSRSFSHFLNATERYLDVLRYLSPDPTSRRILLDGVSNYWRYSSQQRLVTMDKYIQYGVLEGLDVVDWIFAEESRSASGEDGDGWTDGENWELQRMCLDKHVGRVTALRNRMRAVEREDEAARARRAAEKLEQGEGVGEGDEAEPEDVRIDRSKTAQDTQASLDIQMSKLEKIFAATAKHFVVDLLPWCFDASTTNQGLKAVLTLLDNGEEGLWSVRAKLGWWREFVRLYQSHLTPLAGVVEKTIFELFPQRMGGVEPTAESRAEDMVREIWTSALGNES